MKNKTFRKLFSVFVALYVIIFGISIALYTTAVSRITDEHNQNTALQLETISQKIENQVMDILPRLHLLCQDTDVQILTFYYDKMSMYTRSMTLQSMVSKLEQLYKSAPYLDNVGILIVNGKKDGRVYSASYSLNFEQQVEKIGRQGLPDSQHIVTDNNSIYLLSQSGMNGKKICVVGELSRSLIASDMTMALGAGEKIVLESLGEEGDIHWEMLSNAVSPEPMVQVGKSVPVAGIRCTITKFSDLQATDNFLSSFRMLLGLLGCVCIVATVIFYQASRRLVAKPMQQLQKAIDMVEAENYDYKIKADASDDFSKVFDAFNNMTEKISYMIREVYEKTILLQKAQLSQYQAQINPHFLYNSFYTMRRMLSLGQEENVNQFLCYLGDYFVFLHHGSDSNEISLTEELHHARIYANIQEIRFRDRIRIDWEVDSAIGEDYVVPRLIIQPLLENSFKYSLENKLSGGVLRVTLKECADDLVCVVEDNGEVTEEKLEQIRETLSNTNVNERISALSNINRRLYLYYKANVLSADISELGGLKITIRFSVRKKEKL